MNYQKGDNVIVLDAQFLVEGVVKSINKKSITVHIPAHGMLKAHDKRIKNENVQRKICMPYERVYVLMTMPQERYDIIRDSFSLEACLQTRRREIRKTREEK